MLLDLHSSFITHHSSFLQRSWGSSQMRPTELASVDAEIEKEAGGAPFNLIHPRREVVGVWQNR